MAAGKASCATLAARVALCKTMSDPVSQLPRAYRRRFESDAAGIKSRRAELQGASLEELSKLASDLRQLSKQGSAIDAAGDRLLQVDRVESFALAAVAAERTLGLSPYAVQVLAGLALSYGALAEVKTGEGKTLVATLPAVAFALAGNQVHVMTANQYLAERDAAWMKPVYEALGLTVGSVDDHPSKWRRQRAYSCDIVYGTASQFGFDYLNDHLVSSDSLRCQRRREVVIVDEADALLLDEARTPLIISGTPSGSEDLVLCAEFVASLDPSLVDVDLSEKVAMLNDDGFALAESFFDREDLTQDVRLLADLYAALRARFCYRKDKEYLVRDDAVLIIDESTGRTQDDRRWQNGLHEAIEAKEGLTVRRSAPTLGSITIPALLSLYDLVGAMTGTALSDKAEFNDVYGLHVISIPTNKSVQRIDAPDILFPTASAKFAALTADVVARHAHQQPVLIGAPTVADAHTISDLLTAQGVSHEVLSARDPRREAEIIANAGRPGAVTVATNMAGRGVDILLGGDPKQTLSGETPSEARSRIESDRLRVLSAGGLAVLATARHSSRRIDDQLCGRAGRQGEPGFTQFYLSLDDELLDIYANDMAKEMLSRATESTMFSNKMVSRLVATAQGKIESLYKETRRSTNEFAAPIMLQQTTLYQWRDELLTLPPRDAVLSFLRPAWRIQAASGIEPGLLPTFGLDAVPDWVDDEVSKKLVELPDPSAMDYLANKMLDAFVSRNEGMDVEPLGMLRATALAKLDAGWHEHLVLVESAKSASKLRSTAQLRPSAEFIREASSLFQIFTEQCFLEFAQVVAFGNITRRPATTSA